ncbi:hypothetical protein JCM8547_004343 [Rhodosporidiobolus lusitaniae]
MSAPLLPPGLSLTPRLALSTSSLLSLILSYLPLSSSPPFFEPDHDSPPLSYPTLLACATVAKAWTGPARGEMMRVVFLKGGGKEGEGKMRKWVEAAEGMDRRGEKRANEVAVLREGKLCVLTEKEEEVGGGEKEGEAVQWSLPLLRKVMEKLEGVRELNVSLLYCRGTLPGKLLAVKGLKGLKHLTLSLPLSSSSFSSSAPAPTLPFHLTSLTLLSVYLPASSLWFASPTLSLLSATLSPSLKHLHLGAFHCAPFERLLFPSSFSSSSSLVSSVSSLEELVLPRLSITPSCWRLAVFALLWASGPSSKALKLVVMREPEAAALRELLPFFSTSDSERGEGRGKGKEVELVLASFPAELPQSGREADDPLDALVEGLSSWPSHLCEEGGEGGKTIIKLLGLRQWIRVERRFGEGLPAVVDEGGKVLKKEEEALGKREGWMVHVLPEFASGPTSLTFLTTSRSLPSSSHHTLPSSSSIVLDTTSKKKGTNDDGEEENSVRITYLDSNDSESVKRMLERLVEETQEKHSGSREKEEEAEDEEGEKKEPA